MLQNTLALSMDRKAFNITTNDCSMRIANALDVGQLLLYGQFIQIRDYCLLNWREDRLFGCGFLFFNFFRSVKYFAALLGIGSGHMFELGR